MTRLSFFKISFFAILLLNANFSNAQKAIDPLENIQTRIYDAFYASFYAGTGQIEGIIEELSVARQSSDNMYLDYWQAYAHYYLAIHHLKMEEDEKASVLINSAIQLLDELPNPDSESLTLLSSFYSLSISLTPEKAQQLSGKASKNIETALKLDDKNLRAYLVRGKSDFYKPTQYGGGKLVEECLLTALSLEDTYSDISYSPTWGRNEAYSFLVQFYMREDQTEKAKLYCKQGIQKFPEDYMLNELNKKLESGDY